MKFADFLLLEYKGEHQAPTKEDSASLDDLTGNGVYPDDVYTHPQYYTHEDTDKECFSIALACRGKPNKMVRIYRAVPLGDKKAIEKDIATYEKQKAAYQRRNTIPSSYTGSKSNFYDWVCDKIDELSKKLDDIDDDEKIKINDGGWVTLSKKYAEDHGKAALKGKYKVLSKSVKASELHTDGNSLSEWGWNP